MASLSLPSCLFVIQSSPTATDSSSCALPWNFSPTTTVSFIAMSQSRSTLLLCNPDWTFSYVSAVRWSTKTEVIFQINYFAIVSATWKLLAAASYEQSRALFTCACLWFVGCGPVLVISFHYRHKLPCFKQRGWQKPGCTAFFLQFWETNTVIFKQRSTSGRACIKSLNPLKQETDSNLKLCAVTDEQWSEMASCCGCPRCEVLRLFWPLSLRFQSAVCPALSGWPWRCRRRPFSQCCSHWLLSQ